MDPPGSGGMAPSGVSFSRGVVLLGAYASFGLTRVSGRPVQKYQLFEAGKA